MSDNLKYIQQIVHNTANTSTLEKALYLNDDVLQALAKELGDEITPLQAFLFSMIFNKNIEDSNESVLNFIANHIRTDKMELLHVIAELDKLCTYGLLYFKNNGRGRKHKRLNELDYIITYSVFDKLNKGIKISKSEELKLSTFKKLLEEVDACIFKRRERVIEQDEFEERLIELLDRNQHLQQVKNIYALYENNPTQQLKDVTKIGLEPVAIDLEEYKPEDDLIFTLLLANNTKHSESFNLHTVVEEALGDETFFKRTSMVIKNRSHIVQSKGFVFEIKHDIKRKEMEYEFTEKGLDYFLCDEKTDIIVFEKREMCDEILAQDIAEKPLYFNASMQSQFDSVLKILVDNNFESIKLKLKTIYKTSGGICIMLYGEPGTGKTEFVLQASRISQRNLIKVDISDAKSMWYGESERKIKSIFSNYAKSVRKEERTPILFVNEADSLFNKRINVERTIDQTANSIQNILLDELENFNGILMITTNLMQNFDNAFERRFLMKLKFEKPDKSQRELIWKNKLPDLEDKSIQNLAEQYSFSPAEIENIAKKVMIHNLLNNEMDFQQLNKFCQEEKFSQSTKSIIGF